MEAPFSGFKSDSLRKFSFFFNVNSKIFSPFPRLHSALVASSLFSGSILRFDHATNHHTLRSKSQSKVIWAARNCVNRVIEYLHMHTRFLIMIRGQKGDFFYDQEMASGSVISVLLYLTQNPRYLKILNCLTYYFSFLPSPLLW